jgi:hypothetical protein
MHRLIEYCTDRDNDGAHESMFSGSSGWSVGAGSIMGAVARIRTAACIYRASDKVPVAQPLTSRFAGEGCQFAPQLIMVVLRYPRLSQPVLFQLGNNALIYIPFFLNLLSVPSKQVQCSDREQTRRRAQFREEASSAPSRESVTTYQDKIASRSER